MVLTNSHYFFLSIYFYKVVIAAGNEGSSGAFTVSVPSVGHGAYSVASFDNNNNLMDTFEIEGTSESFGMTILIFLFTF